jgi:hypothetical protein
MAEYYPVALDVFATEPEVDVVVSRYSLPRTGSLGILTERLKTMAEARAQHPDRLFAVLSRTTDKFSDEWEAVLKEPDMVFLQSYDKGVRSIGRLGQRFDDTHPT